MVLGLGDWRENEGWKTDKLRETSFTLRCCFKETWTQCADLPRLTRPLADFNGASLVLRVFTEGTGEMALWVRHRLPKHEDPSLDSQLEWPPVHM